MFDCHLQSLEWATIGAEELRPWAHASEFSKPVHQAPREMSRDLAQSAGVVTQSAALVASDGTTVQFLELDQTPRDGVCSLEL